jgi:hypothetical protein
VLQSLIPYATALALSVILGSLLVAFRWRYLRYIRHTIYSPHASEPLDGAEAPVAYNGPAISIAWTEAAVEAAQPDQVSLARALVETRIMYASFAAAGAIYVVAAAAVVFYGARTTHFGIRAAVWLGYASTLVGLVLVLAFGSHGWKTWMAAVTAWCGTGMAILVAIGVTPPRVLSLLGSSLSYVSLPLLVVTPLTLRLLRPLIVAFVPLVGLYIVCTVLLEFILELFGLTFSGHYTPVTVAGGLVTAVAGIGAAIWQLRRGLRRGFVLTLTGMLAVGVVGVSRLPNTDWNLLFATIGGIGFNGLLTLATWSLFMLFLKVKARGRVTDEILHYSFCWLVLTALLPMMAQLEWKGVAPAVLALALYVAALFLLLRWQQRQRVHRDAARMLLLRVFGQEPVRNRLLDALDDSWRRIGRVDLIVGADLAVRSLSTRALQGFLLGRGHGRVLATVEDADRRIAILPKRQAFDGRFPLNELPCSPTVWPHVVRMLAAHADVVLMDFRGWRPSHRGATFELSIALDRVQLSRLVVLADKETDATLLSKAVADAWTHLQSTSVNAQLPRPSLGIIRCSGRRRIDAGAIARAAFTAAESVSLTGAIAPAASQA